MSSDSRRLLDLTADPYTAGSSSGPSGFQIYVSGILTAVVVSNDPKLNHVPEPVVLRSDPGQILVLTYVIGGVLGMSDFVISPECGDSMAPGVVAQPGEVEAMLALAPVEPKRVTWDGARWTLPFNGSKFVIGAR